jgi:hypothetical protein
MELEKIIIISSFISANLFVLALLGRRIRVRYEDGKFALFWDRKER